ncbi:MAG: response regulator [Spirochaetales bacterium]|jgi:DNA-binding response OmpR family regulator|nr:response regulator [Spirochaetales bacterium]
MKKILVIDESSLFLDYLTKKLEENGFEVIPGKSGLDGSVKMRSELPDLIIMDYFLSRKSAVEVLKEKVDNPNISKIPVIMAANKIDKSKLVQCAQYGVKKFFTKPVRIDGLLKAVSELLKVKVSIDSSPCIIEAHLNDEILFIEIARGLNLEKIELLQYKITELLDLYDMKFPKVLLMISDMELSEGDTEKFQALIDTIVEFAGPYASHMKILTSSDFVKDIITTKREYEGLSVSDNLAQAMDDLIGLQPDSVAHDEVVRKRLLSTSEPKKAKDESFQLRFEEESGAVEEAGGSTEGEGEKKAVTLAVVDDDVIIQQLIKAVFQKTGWNVKIYNNGKEFLSDLAGTTFDLIYLDLMMPVMDGFQVLNLLKSKNIHLPIIVLSAVTQQEAVVKAMSLGIHSYMRKPFKPEMLLAKTAELLNSNF